MGSGTSGLQRDLDDLDGAFEGHWVRAEVDAHPLTSAQAPNGAQGIDSAFQAHRTECNLPPGSDGVALHRKLDVQSYNGAVWRPGLHRRPEHRLGRSGAPDRVQLAPEQRWGGTAHQAGRILAKLQRG